jgi:hypothetical protein
MVHPAHPKNDRSRQVSWLAGECFRPPSPIVEWHNGRRLSADSCGSSYRLRPILARTIFPFIPIAGAPCSNKINSPNCALLQVSLTKLPGRRSSISKSGTPKKAVKTPSFNSVTVGMARTAVSASTNKMAPSKAEGNKLRDGIWPQ